MGQTCSKASNACGTLPANELTLQRAKNVLECITASVPGNRGRGESPLSRVPVQLKLVGQSPIFLPFLCVCVCKYVCAYMYAFTYTYTYVTYARLCV